MKRISEQDLILPSLFVISQYPGISTSELIQELRIIFNPTGEDAEILHGRNDDKFSQIVRNLVSHHTLDDRLKYTVLDSSDKNNSRHTLTSAGSKYLEENIATLESLLSNRFDYENLLEGINLIDTSKSVGKKIIVFDENLLVSEGMKKNVTHQVYERSQQLRNKAIEAYSKDGIIICQACGFDFYKAYGDLGKGFIEIHHRKPIFQYEDTDFTKLIKQAIDDLVPLCSNCHRMIHRKRGQILSITDLRNIVLKQKI